MLARSRVCTAVGVHVAFSSNVFHSFCPLLSLNWPSLLKSQCASAAPAACDSAGRHCLLQADTHTHSGVQQAAYSRMTTVSASAKSMFSQHRLQRPSLTRSQTTRSFHFPPAWPCIAVLSQARGSGRTLGNFSVALEGHYKLNKHSLLCKYCSLFNSTIF